MSGKRQSKKTRILLLVTLVITGAIGWLGWNWLQGLELGSIRISGNQHADGESILELAQIDTGEVLLSIDPNLIADRVERHPWVEKARVMRLPPDLLSISVNERSPVALAINTEGLPVGYLDAHGYKMPMTPYARYDVPILKGAALPPHPMRPVTDGSVAELLRALGSLRPEEDVLISSFEVDPSGQISLRTEPVHDASSILVRLGRHDFDERLANLEAFWRRAVVTRPDVRYEWIDLRFNSQIVTREKSGT